MNDLEIISNTQKFKCRVNGLIIRNGKLLVLRMKNKVSFCLPGGHVEFGEDTKRAIIREMSEELQTEFTIEKELAIVENFYQDKNKLDTHEISFYYIVSPIQEEKIPFENFTLNEIDKNVEKQHFFEWLDLSQINNIDFKPSYIKDMLTKNNLNFEHLIIRDC